MGILDTLSERFIRWQIREARTSPPGGVVYVGAFLTPMAKAKLLKHFPAVHPNIFAHHMTVWHYRGGSPLPDLPWGRSVNLKVVGHFANGKAQAVALAVPTKLRRADGRTPHITISTTVDVGPYASNFLFGGEWEPVRGMPAVKAKIGWVDEAEKVHLSAPPITV